MAQVTRRSALLESVSELAGLHATHRQQVVSGRELKFELKRYRTASV